jgi:hypothetical protein
MRVSAARIWTHSLGRAYFDMEITMRMYTCIVALVFGLAGSGCMSDTRTTSTTRNSYDCSGTGKGWDDCTRQADAQCGTNNYSVISGKGDVRDTAPGGNSEMKRTLVVTCK